MNRGLIRGAGILIVVYGIAEFFGESLFTAIIGAGLCLFFASYSNEKD